jgi:hypothetical protein
MADKPCYLKLVVRETSNVRSKSDALRDISISMQLQMGDSLVGSPVQALIQTAASNLVHSLSNDIGTLLLPTPPHAVHGTHPHLHMGNCMYV